MSDTNELSEREREVLCLLATGASNKEIAQKLYISTNTVKVHLRNIFSKIGVTSRTEAVLYAVNAGLAPGLSVTESTADYFEVPPQESIDTAPSVAPLDQRTKVVSAIKNNWKWLVAGGTIGILAIALALLLYRQSSIRALAQLAAEDDTHRWQELTSMPTARAGLAAAAYEDQLFAIGGETSSGVSGVVEAYDIYSNTWQSLASKPTPVKDANAVVIGGRIYVPGGLAVTGQPVNVLEIYDPRQGSWSHGAAVPEAMSGSALAAYEGKLYLFGGWDGQAFSNKVYEYDPQQNLWSKKTPMPTARAYAGAAQAGGKIFVMGGWDGDRALKVNEAYLPDQEAGGGKAWQSEKPLPVGRYGMGTGNIADVILLVGGSGEESSEYLGLRFTPQTQSQQDARQEAWQKFGVISPLPIYFPGMASIGTQFFIYGGRVADLPTAENHSYQVFYTVNLPVIRD